LSQLTRVGMRSIRDLEAVVSGQKLASGIQKLRRADMHCYTHQSSHFRLSYSLLTYIIL